MSTADDNGDDFKPPDGSGAISTGAAADSSDSDARLKGLPRLLRYAMLVNDSADHVSLRLVAEIDELYPRLPHNIAWSAALDDNAGLELAAELDRRAVTDNDPDLRSFADCVRMLCLPFPCEVNHFSDYRRVGKSLVQAFQKVARHAERELCCELERFTFGWAALPACSDLGSLNLPAAPNAVMLGASMAVYQVSAADAAARRKQKEEEERRKERTAEETTRNVEQSLPAATAIGSQPQLVVARLSTDEMKNTKLKDVIGPLKGAINVALPLIEVPSLREARAALAFEFPYALDVIDFVLGDLVGRSTVLLRPLLLVGDPGGGKSRFGRRVGEVLGLPIWRSDASRADGAVFGGTDRRWHTAEPCHPFLAVAQGKVANPAVLIDEIEKAAVRNDYGRLWDCLLAFLEPETNCRYPDPALQTNLDLSQVSYIATANSIDPLPSPIRDRFRTIEFPKPGRQHLDALLPTVVANLAKERGLSLEWLRPLDGAERTVIGRYWIGGSVRRLRRIVEVILRQRDIMESRH